VPDVAVWGSLWGAKWGSKRAGRTGLYSGNSSLAMVQSIDGKMLAALATKQIPKHPPDEAAEPYEGNSYEHKKPR
jgi:hypothetical protein